MMIPVRHSSIFRSRWWALVWAGGILWSAIEFATPDDPGNAQDGNAAVDGISADQAASLLNAIG